MDAAATCQNQLQHLRVQQALHGLPVDVRDEVAGTQAGLKGRAVVLHRHNQVLHGVDIRVPVVDADGTDGESEPSWAPLDDDGGLELCHEWAQLPAGRRIA